MTKNKWGGARPGSGRKPVKEPRKPRAFRLTDKEYAQVKKFIKIMKEDKKMRQNIVRSMKGYILEQIKERGFENNQIEIDFSGLAEEEEIRQAAKELGFEVEPGEGQGVFLVYVEVEIRRNVVESMKEYIQEQIQERGLDEYRQIEIDFSGLAEEEEIRQAAKELGYEVDSSDIYGLFWIYEEV